LRAPLRRAGRAMGSSKKEVVTNRNIRFKKRVLSSVSVLMQQAKRNAFTGEVSIKDFKAFPDFLLVDIARRPRGVLTGGMSELMADKYLFKPIPLMYRTWIYHCMVKSGAVLSGKHDESGLLKHVMSQFCIDAPTVGGRTSPMVYYVPLAIGACLTGNTFLVVITLAVIAVVLTIAKATNTPSTYRKSRLWSLPLRLLYFAAVLLFLDFSSFITLLGFFLTIVLAIVDFVQGDLAALLAYKLHCTYRVLHSLEGRLWVCYRDGAFAWEEMFGDRGKVHEDVSNLAVWERRHHLIADIGDLLVELQPLSEDDWAALRERYLVGSDPIPYLAIDAFDMDQSSSDPKSKMSKILALRKGAGEEEDADADMVLEDF